MRRTIRAIFAVWLWLIASAANAAVSLPLGGYCKPGCYFPIRVDGSDTSRAISFSADAALTTDIEPSNIPSKIVPMLVTGAAHELDWKVGSIPLRIPHEDEKLIACTHLNDIQALADVFPHQRLIPVQLDAVDLLPGPPAAWETLDAIVLDSSLYWRISDAQRSAFLSGGVKLISIGDNAPDADWPWKKTGSLWILSLRITGPLGELVNENIYTPTYGWRPGWSAAVRRQVMGIATLIVLITIALMLRPNRITFIAAIIFSVLASIGVILWRDSLGTVTRAGGDIVIKNNALTQTDAYVFERARESATQIIPWTGWTHPLFASDAELARSNMHVKCSANDELSFTYQAAPDHTMAFLHRAIIRSAVIMGSLPIMTVLSPSSPMEDAARAEYLNSENRIVGETAASSGRWASVMIQSR